MAGEQELRRYLQRAVTELHQARERLRATREPIVIVGGSCRFPGGVASAEDLWQLVTDERDAVSRPPADRGWQGTGPEPAGGFLSAVAAFDPPFFGLGEREAALLDPQSRLLLETSWEALTRSGIDPPALRRSRTGVFTGLMYSDYYSHWRDRVPDAERGDLMLGSSASLAAGRLSYLYGFNGPTFTVDTACSSGLVALHQAVSALRNGECDLALVAAASVASSPLAFDFSRRQGMLSSDGRSRSFAAGADGWGLSEGVGVLVLQRQLDHERTQRPALAIVRGSAINQVGAGPGLTLPSTASQRQVIESALESAGLAPADVDVVEGHGTGTPLGDAVEVRALAAAYSAGRPGDRPLLLGSVKSNIGHTQAPGGIAGILKTALAMRHGVVPRSLHAERPSEQIDWQAANIRLVDAATDWPEREGPRRAGVSSFGISGTNAHLILEQPAPEVAARSSRVADPVFRRKTYWPADTPNVPEGAV
ncbi:beta-ketoacyl synthase N-terminal-like domain-containing protein [Streptomyces mirabilis]|uniref:beta-ketoacyl synthase N-terminal-like domain-containing protein n=1 Tax=Streptomyces mirabilis TaxID=68239 RepID=UPI0036CE27CB